MSNNIDSFFVRKNIFVVAGSTFLVSLLFFLYSLKLQNQYLSEATLIPSTNIESGSAVNPRFGSLAKFAGVDIGVSNGNKLSKAIHSLRSRDFLIPIISGGDVPRMIFENLWDDDEKNWKERGWISKLISTDSDGSERLSPSDLALYRKFIQDHYRVYEDSESNIVRIQVILPDPIIAKNLLETIIEGINKKIKYEDVVSAKSTLEFLKLELTKANQIGVKSVLHQLMEQQLQKLALAQTNPHYAFEVIDHPFLADKKFRPRRALIVFWGLFVGGMFGLGYVVFFESGGCYLRGGWGSD